MSTLPMDSMPNNVMFCANDLFVLFSCDMILIFSEYVPSSVDRYYLGYLYLSIFAILFTTNVTMMILEFKKKFQEWRANKKHKQKVQEEKYRKEFERQDQILIDYAEKHRKRQEKKKFDVPEHDVEDDEEESKEKKVEAGKKDGGEDAKVLNVMINQ